MGGRGTSSGGGGGIRRGWEAQVGGIIAGMQVRPDERDENGYMLIDKYNARVLPQLDGMTNDEKSALVHEMLTGSHWVDASDFARVVSRMDEKSATKLYREILASDQSQWTGLHIDAVTMMAEFGPTAGFRAMVAKTNPFNVGDDLSRLSKSATEDRMLKGWTMRGGSRDSLLTQAAVNQTLLGQKTTVVHWNSDYAGVKITDPGKHRASIVQDTYKATQDYYASQGVTKLKVYRGVSTKITKHAPVESWTTDKATAQAFGSRVMTATVSVKDVLFSHKTMKGWDEDSVVGKQEVAVLGRAFD